MIMRPTVLSPTTSVRATPIPRWCKTPRIHSQLARARTTRNVISAQAKMSVRRDSAGYRTKVEAAKSSITEMPEAVKSLDRSSSALAALGSRYMPRSPRMDANTSDSTICSGRYTSCST